jgi:hypothetical protein
MLDLFDDNDWQIMTDGSSAAPKPLLWIREEAESLWDTNGKVAVEVKFALEVTYAEALGLSHERTPQRSFRASHVPGKQLNPAESHTRDSFFSVGQD